MTPDPCCVHCGHAAWYSHPPHSHCALCFPTDDDRARYALFQAACALAGVEIPIDDRHAGATFKRGPGQGKT